jgi:hypothetical protein
MAAPAVKLSYPPLESPGRTKPTNFATRHRLVISSLTLLPGHGIKSSRFLLNVLAAALGAFRLHFASSSGFTGTHVPVVDCPYGQEQN